MIEPFRIDVPQAVLDDLQRRLAGFRPLPAVEDRGWEDGTDRDYLAALIDHWRHRYDWRERERALNRLDHAHAEVGGARLHFVRQPGRGPAPLPLLLAHGWPDSYLRFAKLIPLLADPAAHGGDPADAFDVVVPSLPGYGYSERLPRGTGVFGFGDLMHRLMTDRLGYARYGAHGGDIGSMVCEQLAHGHTGAVVGVHMTDVSLRHAQHQPGDLTAAERRYFAQVGEFRRLGGGYMHIQGTKPWTPAAALNDSPAGLAAWMVEKYQAWSDCGGDVESRFTKDELLDQVMLYWTTQTIGTSFLAYRDFTKPGAIRGAVEGVKEKVAPRGAPAGFALFPHDIATPPREWAERFYHVHRWSEMASGGHFAAMEEPARLAEEIRAFFRPLRAG